VLAFGSVWVAVIGSADVDLGSIWVNDDTGRVLRIQPRG
jgi:hypothetical protein